MASVTQGGNGIDEIDHLKVQKRYEEERDKRLRTDGDAQFVDISLSDKFQYFQNDPWVDASMIKDAQTMFPNNRCQILILGAGWGGLCYAVRMVQAGIRPEDIRIIDIAGGFGGTWYYNRYPGLTCDIESYCYLPFLEEMGYMPKHRYTSGEEIRNYANLVAERFNLAKYAVFQTRAEKLEWDEATKEWQVQLLQMPTGTGEPSQALNIRSQFVVTTGGVLNRPKLPGVPGIANYRGDTFHSSRWDYSITGGCAADPCLEKLKDKRVAIIGTGASAVQIVPYVARYAKHLYVAQRTPASIGIRGQRKTDPEW
jgi:cation diffusion facilitator CzcD-associated flavoprotein CzcO